MGGAIRLRADFTGDELRMLAKQHKEAACTRRLLALSIIYDGGRRSDAARFGGVGLQIIRDWVLRFNANGPAGLETGKAPGRKALLNDEQRKALTSLVDSGPQFERDGIVRWRLCDLVRWIDKEFNITASRQTVGRELRIMGYRKLSAQGAAAAIGVTSQTIFDYLAQGLIQGQQSMKGQPWQISLSSDHIYQLQHRLKRTRRLRKGAT